MVPTSEEVPLFGVADYAVFVVMLCVSSGIGVFYACTGKKQATTSEFLFGGRTMQVIPVAISVLATFISAITLLGVPAEVYQFGIQYWMINIAYCFMIPVIAHIYVPVFYKLQVSSIYEYLERRFSRNVRTVAFAVTTAGSLIYMAFVVYAPSLVLSQVTGLNVWVCVLSIGIVCTFYTSVGGIKAVVWTDVFQTVVIFSALITVLVKGILNNGGIERVWEIAREGKRTDFIDLSLDPTERHTFLSLTFGGFFTWLSIYGVNQAMIQRTLTIPNLKGAKRVIWLNLPGNIVTVTITCLLGLVVYVNYAGCDPLSAKRVNDPNQVFPLFVMETLGFLPGMSGLFVSGIFSGALSTLSSSLNSLAAVTLEDIVKIYIAPEISEVWATRTAKLLALVYGVVAIVLVAIVNQMTGTVLQAALSISGTLGGPLLGLFTLGMFFPWPTSFGAMTGLCCSIATCLWICIGAILNKQPFIRAPLSVDFCPEIYLNATRESGNVTKLTSMLMISSQDTLIFYRLSYLWYGAVGFFVVIAVGLLSSLIRGQRAKDIDDPNIMCSFFFYLWKCDEVSIKNNWRESSSVATITLPITPFKTCKRDGVLPADMNNGIYRKSENSFF